MDNFQTLPKIPKPDFKTTNFTSSEVKYQFQTRINSYLQFWEYIKKSLKLVFHLDQIQYFLSFQMSFYGKSKFQPLSGKHISHLVLEVTYTT